MRNALLKLVGETVTIENRNQQEDRPNKAVCICVRGVLEAPPDDGESLHFYCRIKDDSLGTTGIEFRDVDVYEITGMATQRIATITLK